MISSNYPIKCEKNYVLSITYCMSNQNVSVFRTEKLYPKPLSFRHLEEVFQLTHTLNHLEDVFQPIDTLNQTHKRKNKKQIS